VILRGVKAAMLLIGVLSPIACSDGRQSVTGTGPALKIAVTPMTAVVHAGATLQLTAAVSNDATNQGVTWRVSCAATQCGRISPDTTASGTAVAYTAPATLPQNGARITITATAIADAAASAAAIVIPVGQIAGYDVGVDYHAYGLDIDKTGFVSIYDQPQVRQTVQAQLQGMADRGATSIQTAIWVAKGEGNTCCSTAQVTFPMTNQEQANVRAYAQDVASIVGAGGNRLRLDIALEWLGVADFTIGSPTTTLGTAYLVAAEFTSRVLTTTDQVLAAVGDVTRPDGVKVVETIFFVSEADLPDAMTPPGPIANYGWFLTTNYLHFVSAASQAGLRPSVYFVGGDGCTQDVVLDDGYVDALFPILNGHRSMFFMYRGLKFMIDNGLPVPSGRIDFDCYINSTGAPYDQLVQRILDDADATLPSLGAPKVYDIPETYYIADPAVRLQYGQAFAAQAAQHPRLQRVSFWTTPGGGPGMVEHNSAYPFTIEDFLPAPP
jgi:hypothetical protein